MGGTHEPARGSAAGRREGEALPDACVRVALDLIAEKGIEALSLREVARRLGVSHQAPYKHFRDRDDIVAAVLKRCFSDFGDFLETRAVGEGPEQAMANLGRAYVRFAREEPLKYRLMFSTPMPRPGDHPAMMAEAQRAYGLLHKHLAAVRAARGADATAGLDPERDALFVWAVVHGLAGILESDITHAFGFSDALIGSATEAALARIGTALGLEHSPAKSNDLVDERMRQCVESGAMSCRPDDSARSENAPAGKAADDCN